LIDFSKGMMKLPKNIYAQLLECMQSYQKVNMVTNLYKENSKIGQGLIKKIEYAPERLKSSPEVCQHEEETIFYEPVAGTERLIILGGGHIALPLCEFAAKTGFNVTVVDDRPQFANTTRFPYAQRVMCEAFGKAMAELKISDRDYVVLVTRGHRHDADCLRYLLNNCSPFYLGMIGSRRRVRGLFAMLEEEGYSRDLMQEVSTPIGLDIGAILPEEIAISILAELISYRRKSNQNIVNSDLDLNVVEYLAELTEPAAIVTVMNTKGSTPRGAGAKMVVNPYGMVYGSIGGGCAEKDVINQAIRIIGSGEYQLVNVDLTGDVAESEGMVCGGVMDILIEDYPVQQSK
jgi:xanthine dehydrogenase accessory factor